MYLLCINLLLLDFINKIDELRTEVAYKLFNDINGVLIDRINSESVVELMEISTHQYIEEITAEKISVVKIGVSSMRMHIDGSIGALNVRISIRSA